MQLLARVEPAGECELAGHAWQLADPTVLLYVSVGHREHVLTAAGAGQSSTPAHKHLHSEQTFVSQHSKERLPPKPINCEQALSEPHSDTKSAVESVHTAALAPAE